MKRFILFSLAMSFCMFVVAQKMGHLPAYLENLAAKRPVHLSADDQMDLTTGSYPMVYPHPGKAFNETEIGQTRYDLQTNQAVQNRIYAFPDGTIGATWTFGNSEPSYPERGTGYNYFTGSAWGPEPTVRVESARCGWPSYMPLPGGGELLISHNGTTGLLVSKRATKGTGAWTTTTLLGPVTSGGTTALIWPRAVASGNTIHLIACSDPPLSGPPYYNYQGLANALIYFKSTDGGATWSAPAILPGMDSATCVYLPNHTGFGGDSYSWAAPKGDTIGFVVGESWGGLFVMKSFDAGNTWTKLTIYDFPRWSTAPTPIIATVDGSCAMAIDNAGMAHVVVGKMRVSDDDFTDNPAQSSYYPYTDGLLYWNETMSPWDSATLNDNALLMANGQYIGGMLDFSGNDTIDFPAVASGQWPFGTYYLSLSSMPQINILGNNVMVTFSSCREDKTNPGASPNEQLYRHVFKMRSHDLGVTWDSIVDMTASIFHDFDECIFASLSFTSDTSYYIVYQADEEPGLAVRGDEDANTDNRIYCMSVLEYYGVREDQNTASVKIYPNPASDHTYIDFSLKGNENVHLSIFNMLGQTVFTNDYGKLIAGQNKLEINTGNLTDGMYFISLQTGDTRLTGKFTVQ